MNSLQSLIAAVQGTEPVLERLDPPRRAAVVMALLALTLIGLFLVVFVMVGGRWVRRMARQRPSSLRQAGGGPTASDQQLRKSLETFLPEAKTDDTIQSGVSPSDTKVEG